MTHVAHLLDSKGHDVWTIGQDATVYDAIARMAEKEVGALLVVEGERLVGIISERDYARKVILRGRTSEETRVRDIMTSSVITVRPDQTIDQCMDLVTTHRIRHLPVLEGDRIVGMISIGDLIKAIISDREQQIEHLERYITGAR